jgi:hypothetical protein
VGGRYNGQTREEFFVNKIHFCIAAITVAVLTLVGFSAAGQTMIYNVNDLQNMSSNLGGNYKLANDIDAAVPAARRSPAMSRVSTATGTVRRPAIAPGARFGPIACQPPPRGAASSSWTAIRPCFARAADTPAAPRTITNSIPGTTGKSKAFTDAPRPNTDYDEPFAEDSTMSVFRPI